MSRSLALFSVFSVGLIALGCRFAGAEEKRAAARGKASQSAMQPERHVGTNPGNVGNGTPLAPAAGHELGAFAAGCFWGVEDAFRKVRGVTATAVGYTGGHTKDPTYPKVCEHDTGHAETVLLEFDPKVVSYEKLLTAFFEIHDPTTMNRQGPDVGDQYRSAIFTFSPAQADAAKKAIAKEQAKIGERIVTQVSPIAAFYTAEQ